MNVAKIGVIDVGGGLRGIYAAGVFDWCLENGVKFDCAFRRAARTLLPI